MNKLSTKIAFSIIIAGLFIIISFVALDYQNLSLSFYNVIGFLTIFVFLFGFAMGNKYSFPVREMLEKADNASKGNLKSRFNLNTKDEIEDLSKAFNKIIEGLEKSKSEAETIKKSGDIKFRTKSILSEQVVKALEEKVKNRTSELERTIMELERVKEQLNAKDREVLNLTNQIGKKSKK